LRKLPYTNQETVILLNIRITPSGGQLTVAVFLALATLTPPCVNAQTPSLSKEYIRLGGQVIAIENATAPNASLSPGSSSFPGQTVGTSSTQTITLANNGTAALTVTSIIITTNTPFTETDTCVGATIAASGGACSILVTFSPTTTGTFNATLTVTDNSGNIAGSQQTAALSGTAVAAPTSSATYLGTDTTTHGTWTGAYGADGRLMANNTSIPPIYATVNLSGDPAYTWAASSTDLRDLQTANGSSTRFASTYYGYGSFTIGINLTDGNTHRVAFYLLDWEGAGRAETITITDAAGSAVLNTQSFSNFTQGVWAVWNLTGNVVITVTQTGNTNAVVSGIFFGGAAPAQSASGATITTPNSQGQTSAPIIDSQGTSWTLAYSDEGWGLSFENNAWDGGWGFITLLYYQGTMYGYAENNNWYSHASGSWLFYPAGALGAPNGLGAQSASGTTITVPDVGQPDTGPIIDSQGTMWTLSNPAGAQYSEQSLENGVWDTGWGFEMLLYQNGTVYGLASGGNAWYSHASGVWLLYNAGDPRPGGTGVQSPSGTTITIPPIGQTTTSSIIDSEGTVWTLASTDQYQGQSLENGVWDNGYGIVTLLYYNGTIYANAADGNYWAVHTSGGWMLYPAGDPSRGAVPSPDDMTLTIPPSWQTAGPLIDGQGNVWRLAASGQASVNGAPDTSLQNVSLLLYCDGVIYAQAGASSNWYSHLTGTWVPYDAGDPRGLGAPSPSGAYLETSGPTEAQLTDNQGNAWTLPASGQASVNGASAGSTVLNLLLYYNGVIYGRGNQWYSHASGIWVVYYAGDPRYSGAPSPSGTFIQPWGPNPAQIVDNQGNVWILPANLAVLKNGSPEGSTSISGLLYYNGTMYERNLNGNWYSHASGNWMPCSGDPRLP
jgi:hypothetical protein